MMRSQNEIARAFFRFPAQILHFLGLPLLFAVFILLYRPENAISMLDMGRGLTDFNLVIVSCIMLGTLLVTRLVLFLFRKIMHPNYLVYLFWCIWEMLVFSLFAALYIHLMMGKTETYFTIVAACISNFATTLFFPYIVFSLHLVILGMREESETEQTTEDGRIRFKDDSGKLRIVISSDSILYIESKENYVNICYVDAEVLKHFTLRSSMKRLEPMMKAHGIRRCHRTFFVNPRHIKVLSKDAKGYIMANLDWPSCPPIPVSKTYSTDITESL